MTKPCAFSLMMGRNRDAVAAVEANHKQAGETAAASWWRSPFLRASNATVEGAGEQEEPAAAAAGSNQNRKKGVYSDSTKTKQASSETVRKWTTTRHWLVLCNCDDDTVDKRQ